MEDEPTLASLQAHAVPPWFGDAKLGIFVHWSTSSVPAYAPVGPSPFELAATHGWEHSLRHSPYAEWYWNSLALGDSPVAAHHRAHHGDDPYESFVDRFREVSQDADLGRWARLFAAAGARYVVMVTKHHDGYLLWPSEVANPRHGRRWQSPRDLVGDLAEASRSAGLRFGVYYSGGIDWTFQGLGIGSLRDLFAAVPTDTTYRAYADAHWRELMTRYQPDVLWNDIGYPGGFAGAAPLMAEFYRRNPDGVVNDRFDLLGSLTGTAHYDFTTPEYSTKENIEARPWETCRGMGPSFGFNHSETDADLIGPVELVRLLADVVAKNGNLLLNVGPTATGEIPWAQQVRLLALGAWLDTNGEAVYATRPWMRYGATTDDGVDVRFTAGPEAVYAIVCGAPRDDVVAITDVDLPGEVHLLGYPRALERVPTGAGFAVRLPALRPPDTAFALRVGRSR